MTASERLRELDAQLSTGMWMYAKQDVLDALPEIIAVVSAAEDELRSEDCAKTVVALAALDAKLTQ